VALPLQLVVLLVDNVFVTVHGGSASIAVEFFQAADGSVPVADGFVPVLVDLFL
jgi:hypothetical protein